MEYRAIAALSLCTSDPARLDDASWVEWDWMGVNYVPLCCASTPSVDRSVIVTLLSPLTPRPFPLLLYHACG